MTPEDKLREIGYKRGIVLSAYKHSENPIADIREFGISDDEIEEIRLELVEEGRLAS